ncbi:hypothetical protein HY249_01550, partial [Candidatus Azambacteria bacterium]|nr:hypothetical protein [Candidatus Azambacteria bacterium]
DFKSLHSRLFGGLKLFEEKLIIQKSKISGLVRLLKSLSPKEILKRGYSIVRLNGEILTSIKKVKKRDKLELSLSDGELGVEVL